jgi:acyl carrier protein
MTSDRKELEGDLMHFVQSRGARYAQATLQTDLLETGILDSLLLMDLIFHIEGAYGLRFDSDQVNPSNFRTIEDTVSYVLKQKASPRA